MSKEEITAMKNATHAALELLEGFADTCAAIRKAVDDDTWEALDMSAKMEETLQTALEG